MMNDQFRKWLNTSSDSELEERYAAGPTNEEAQLIAFELDRRKLQRQSKISSAAMWASIAAAVAAVVILVVTLFQIIMPTADELAEREQIRRESQSLYADCTRKSIDLFVDAAAFQSSFENDGMSNFAKETTEEIFKAVKEINDRAVAGLASMRFVSTDVRDESEFDLELRRSDALGCIDAIAGWTRMLDELKPGESLSK